MADLPLDCRQSSLISFFACQNLIFCYAKSRVSLTANMDMADYSILQQYDSENDEKRFLPVAVRGVHQSYKCIISWTAITLFVSVSFNVYNVMQHSQPPCSMDQVPSTYGTCPPN